MADVSPEGARRDGSDPLADAARTIAWLIVLNKPIYPVYVWWLVGSGVAASAWTMAAAPLFLAVALGASRHPTAARVALPVIGLIDTLFATKLFGAAGGTELFVIPCLLLACLSFRADERVWTRVLVGGLFIAFVAAHGRLGAPLHVWSGEELERLRELNILAVASLSAFIGWRFAGLDRAGRG